MKSRPFCCLQAAQHSLLHFLYPALRVEPLPISWTSSSSPNKSAKTSSGSAIPASSRLQVANAVNARTYKKILYLVATSTFTVTEGATGSEAYLFTRQMVAGWEGSWWAMSVEGGPNTSTSTSCWSKMLASISWADLLHSFPPAGMTPSRWRR